MSSKRIFALYFSTLLILGEALHTSATFHESRVAQAYENLSREHVAGSLLLTNHTDDPAELKKNLLRLKTDYEIEKVESLTTDNTSIQISFGSEEDLAMIMASVSHSITLEPDYIVSSAAIPNDAQYAEQWYLNNTGQSYHSSANTTTQGTANIDTNWQDTYEHSQLRGEGITIAIIDSGLNSTHTELIANLWTNPDELSNSTDDDGNSLIDDTHGWNFINNTNDFTDDLGHGTQAAGIIAARENGTGIIGIAPKAKIMPLKVLNSQGNGSTSNVIKAINYAVSKGAKVINMSFGGPGADTLAMRTACNNAMNSGTVIVAAAGNNNYDIATNHFAPASIASVIAVGSISNTGAKASFSNTGTPLSLVTPGIHILTTRSNSSNESTSMVLATNHIISSGTSFSSPMVAAAAALILEQNPTFTPAQIRNTLEQSARDLGTPGKDTQFGYGLLDISAALDISAPTPTPPVNTTPTITSANWNSNPITKGGSTLLTITATDIENDTLTVTADFSPIGSTTQTLSMSSTNTYTSTSVQPVNSGSFTIPYSVTDNTNTATGSILLTVNAAQSIAPTITIIQPSSTFTVSTTASSLTLGGTTTGEVDSITINNETLTTFNGTQSTWSKEVNLTTGTNVFNVNALNSSNELLVSDSIVITKTATSTVSETPEPEETTTPKPKKKRKPSRDEDDPIVIAQVLPPINFLDIESTHFAYQQISDLSQKGAIQGVNNLFHPNKAISRAEFLKIAMTDAGLIDQNCSTTPTYFTDTAATAFKDIISCAVGQSIIANDSKAFSPHSALSRQQAILWLIAIRRVTPTGNTTVFPDVTNSITIPYIETARNKLWISGQNGLFHPYNTLSRAEATKIIVNSRH